MSHSPAPWTWEQIVGTVDHPQVTEFTLKGPDVLCRYWYDKPPSADALLIAAAPYLLAACEEFVRKVECGEAKSVRSYAQMKDAIAKAKGTK